MGLQAVYTTNVGLSGGKKGEKGGKGGRGGKRRRRRGRIFGSLASLSLVAIGVHYRYMYIQEIHVLTTRTYR